MDRQRPDNHTRFALLMWRATHQWRGKGRLKVSLAILAAVALQGMTIAMASFINIRTAGPQALVNATLVAPSGLTTANGGCSGGNAQTNVALSWSASSAVDANGSYLVDNYAALRATAQTGTYASVGTTSGQPPATTLTNVNPTGAAIPQVFVGNGATTTVHAVNTSSNAGTSVTTGTMGTEPNGLAVTPDGTSVVAAEGASSQVQVIAVSTDTVARTVAIPKVGSTVSRPDAVAITPDGLTAYIVDGANNLVYPMTIATGVLGTGISVGTQGDPSAIVTTPSGGKVYVANYGAHSVSVITTSSNTVTATVTIGAGSSGKPIALALTPNSAHVYVADQGNGQIDDITTSTDTVTKTITAGSMVDGNVTGGGDPNILAITPDGLRLYDANYTAGTVLDVATATDTVSKTIALATGQLGNTAAPNAVAMTPNGCQLYVNDYENNQLDVIALSSDTVVATSTVGQTGDPFGMSVSPDSAYVYSPNYYDSTVSVVSTATNTVSATLATAQVGANPYAVLATPTRYWYELQAGHGSWRSSASGPVSMTLGWNQGGWQ